MLNPLALVLFSLPNLLRGKPQHSPSPDVPAQGDTSSPLRELFSLPPDFASGPGAPLDATKLSAAAHTANPTGGNPSSAAERKLGKAAREFEAQLFTAFWQSMHDLSLTGADGADDDPGHNTLSQMSLQALASSLAAHGGFGISTLLVKQLLPKLQANPLQSVGTKGHS